MRPGRPCNCCSTKGSWWQATGSCSPAVTTWSSTGRPIRCGCCRWGRVVRPRAWANSDTVWNLNAPSTAVKAPSHGNKLTMLSPTIAKESSMRITTLMAGVVAAAVAAPGLAAEKVRIVNEGGIKDQWTLAEGTKLAAPGYPAALVERGDSV